MHGRSFDLIWEILKISKKCWKCDFAQKVGPNVISFPRDNFWLGHNLKTSFGESESLNTVSQESSSKTASNHSRFWENQQNVPKFYSNVGPPAQPILPRKDYYLRADLSPLQVMCKRAVNRQPGHRAANLERRRVKMPKCDLNTTQFQ